MTHDMLGPAQAKTLILLNNLNKEKVQYEDSLSCSPTNNAYVSKRTYKHLTPEQTGIVDSGTTHIYIAPNAPYEKMDTTGKQIRVGTANGQVANSTAMATLPVPQVKSEFPTKGYIMPTFTNKLIGVGPICDAYCTVVLKKEDVTVLSPKGEPILQGWIEDKLLGLWRIGSTFGDSTVTSSFLNTTVKSASKIGPTLMR